MVAYETGMMQSLFEEKVKFRLTVIMLVCLGISASILFRAAYIQLPKNARLEAMAKRQFQTRALVRPRRGTIFDRNGEALAVNLETNSLAANPTKIRNKRALARVLSRSVDLSYARIFQKLSEKREFVWIKRHLSDQQIKKFKKLRIMDAEGDLVDGLWLVKESERVYPHGKLAAHILGDVNVDSEGLEGVELWMNEQLRGKVVSVSAIKDALGRPTFIDADAAKSVQDGESVSLTLDASLQFEVELELSNAIRKTGARAGSVIVMNATNGEILALANEPTFNPHDKGVAPERRRNRAITDGYEPGSTFKAMLMSGVLAYGGHSSDQVWGEKGSFVVQGHKISEAESHEKFEWVTLKRMIQVSSNVAAAKFALKLGADRLLRTVRAFGLGFKTGLGFPGEISGRIPNRKDWTPLTVANIGFGQGILVTPLQMTRAYAALLNGGWLIRPKLLRKNRSEGSLNDQPIRIFSRRVSREVLEALSSVTEEGGTGMKASLAGYRVAGKTGTAQMVDVSTGKYSREKYVASFIGFPLDVEPKIVIFTSLSEPHGNYYASETAAPLFREVISSVANRCNLPVTTSASKIIAEERLIKDKLKLTQASYLIRSQTPAGPLQEYKLQHPEGLRSSSSGWVVPSFRGLSPREVMQVLKGHPFHLEVIGSGIVSSQNPEAGKTVAEEGTIRLVLSEP